MNTLPSEDASKEKSNTSRIRYIEELANFEDAWISITDAARITRTSEAMARRWVTSGRLPVKRQAVGINQHTRLVRLSDVASIRPIIDPTAAISDEVHTLDLPSIPRQQAQLMHDHEHLLQQVLAGQKALEELSVQVHDQKNVLEQSQLDRLEQEKKIHYEMELLHTTLREQLETNQTTMQHMIQERVDALTQQLHDWQAHTECLYYDFTRTYQQQNERVQHTLEGLVEIDNKHHQELERFHQELTEQQKDIVEFRQEVTHVIGQQVEVIETALTQQIREQGQQITDGLDRLEKIEQHVMQVREAHGTILVYQRQLTFQDRQIQRLNKILQDESQARKKSAFDLVILQKQIQVLQREVESMKRRNTTS